MKIHEVEALVGVTKKNIRFYEQEGLLNPSRSNNGYRDYSPEDVKTLQQIKLLRKLDIPLEEIKRNLDYFQANFPERISTTRSRSFPFISKTVFPQE